jgi:hypothetical protein
MLFRRRIDPSECSSDIRENQLLSFKAFLGVRTGLSSPFSYLVLAGLIAGSGFALIGVITLGMADSTLGCTC